MGSLSGKRRVIFWIVIIPVFLVAPYVMFLAFNPRIGNPLVTILVITLIYVVGIAGAWYKFKRWGWF